MFIVDELMWNITAQMMSEAERPCLLIAGWSIITAF